MKMSISKCGEKKYIDKEKTALSGEQDVESQ